MRRLVTGMLLVLGACASPSDTAAEDPTEYVVVRAFGSQILTLSEPEQEAAAKPDIIYWTLEEPVEVTPGDAVEVVHSDRICQESYPPTCFISTVRVERDADDAVALFGPFDEQDIRAELAVAPYLDAAIVNAGETFTDDELGDPAFHRVRVIEADAESLADHSDLPGKDTPIIIAAPDDEVDELGAILFEEGYSVVIAFAH